MRFNIAENVHNIHQIDLINMRRLKIEHKGILYCYVLSLTDVFSRFHWLVELSAKHAKIVKNEFEKVYCEHICSKFLQSDGGGEFFVAVSNYCIKNKIKTIKIKTIKEFRKKVDFDIVSKKSWIKFWAGSRKKLQLENLKSKPSKQPDDFQRV